MKAIISSYVRKKSVLFLMCHEMYHKVYFWLSFSSSGFWISRFNNLSNWRKEYLTQNFWFIDLTADATSKVFSSIWAICLMRVVKFIWFVGFKIREGWRYQEHTEFCKRDKTDVVTASSREKNLTGAGFEPAPPKWLVP